MRIFWQSFVDPATGGSYLARLTAYLNRIAAPGTEVVVEGMAPPDRDFGRLAEFRCAAQAIGRALRLQGFDAYAMGHFQDPGLYEIRSALEIPVVGAGEATLFAAAMLGRRIGIITLSPEFEVWHLEQAERYGLGARLVGVTALASTPAEFNAAFAGDGAVRDSLRARLTAAGEALVARGADVIVTGGVLPGLFVADHPGLTIGHAPVVNCASVALKSAEMWAQLHRLDGLGPSRGPAFGMPKGPAREDALRLLPGGQEARGPGR